MSLSITVIRAKTFSVSEDNEKTVLKKKKFESNVYISAKGANLSTVFSGIAQKSAQKKLFFVVILALCT